MPPVTAERSPPASRITGADSPVIADSSTEPTPSMISPSAGMTWPASTTTMSPRRRSAAGTSSRPPVSVRRKAIVVVRVARSAFACALPRPSATASAKFANSTVSQSQTAIVPVNQSGSESLAPKRSRKKIDRRDDAAQLDDEDDRVADERPRVELAERVADRREDDRRARRCCRSGVVMPVSSSSARLSSSTFTPGSPKMPSERPSVASSISSLDALLGEAALLGDARGLELGVGRRDVRVDARAGRRDGVDGDVADLEAGLYGRFEREDRRRALARPPCEVGVGRAEVGEGRGRRRCTRAPWRTGAGGSTRAS